MKKVAFDSYVLVPDEILDRNILMNVKREKLHNSTTR